MPILSLPNLLTLSRILAIPAVVGTFYVSGDYARWFACALFSAAGVTDWLDGHMARRQSVSRAVPGAARRCCTCRRTGCLVVVSTATCAALAGHGWYGAPSGPCRVSVQSRSRFASCARVVIRGTSPRQAPWSSSSISFLVVNRRSPASPRDPPRQQQARRPKGTRLRDGHETRSFAP